MRILVEVEATAEKELMGLRRLVEFEAISQLKESMCVCGCEVSLELGNLLTTIVGRSQVSKKNEDSINGKVG